MLFLYFIYQYHDSSVFLVIILNSSTPHKHKVHYCMDSDNCCLKSV